MRNRDIDYLFSRPDLRHVLDHQRKSISSDVDALDDDRLLSTPEADLVRHFVEKNLVETPTLRRDAWSIDEREVTQSFEDYGHQVTRKVQQLEVHVPFDGEAELFALRPGTYTFSPPVARVAGQILVLTLTPAHGDNADAIRASINRELDHIDSYLAWTRADVDAHNYQLEGLASQAVTARRELLLKRRGLVAALGIPVRERAGTATTYAAPGVRRKVAPALPKAPTKPFAPEPVLAVDTYEHILGVMQNMTLVMERNPATFARMNEEALRDHFLVQLNGHYEGAATGETFNAAGKTDILIREGERNIFIAECKIWKGAKGFDGTIDQLFGYASWRDSKTAIVIFNRNRDTSRVISEVRVRTAAHANFKRELPYAQESGYRCIMCHPSDASRELILTVLVFDIPTPRSKEPSNRPNRQ